MKMSVHTGLLVAVIMAATTGATIAEQAPASEPQVLRDGDGAKTQRFDNMYQVRFIELFLAGREAKTGRMVAACFNTMYTSNPIPASKDTAPQALVQSLNMDKLRKDYGVVAVNLNGPKVWLPDWVEVAVGKEREFSGMQAGWVAQLELSDKGGIGEDTPYQPMSIARTSKWAWNKGRRMVILDDPEGSPWVLKGFQLGLKPEKTYEEFLAAGGSQFKKLPPGWKVRVKTLEEDLIEIPETGVATIMTDEFMNVWDKTGPGMTNFKP
ncbi:MAG: hypothetical protein ABL907_22465 [Hyphomicrobium sp.]